MAQRLLEEILPENQSCEAANEPSHYNNRKHAHQSRNVLEEVLQPARTIKRAGSYSSHLYRKKGAWPESPRPGKLAAVTANSLRKRYAEVMKGDTLRALCDLVIADTCPYWLRCETIANCGMWHQRRHQHGQR